MTHVEVRERLDALLEGLPEDKAQLLLDFAAFLKQQAQAEQPPPASTAETDVWEEELIAAEEYWFGLPETTRQGYLGQTVAVINGRILGSDSNRAILRAHIRAQYPDQTVLYIEADAERLPSLVVRSPRLG